MNGSFMVHSDHRGTRIYRDGMLLSDSEERRWVQVFDFDGNKLFDRWFTEWELRDGYFLVDDTAYKIIGRCGGPSFLHVTVEQMEGKYEIIHL